MNRASVHLIRAGTSSPSFVQPCRYSRRIGAPPIWSVPKYDTRFTKRDAENTTLFNVPVVTDENIEFAAKYPMSPLVEGAQEQSDEAWTPTSKRTGMLVRKIGIVPQWLNDGTRIMCTMLHVLDNQVISYVDAETWYRRSIIGKRKAYNKHGAFGKLTVGAIDADPNTFTAEYNSYFSRAGVASKKKLASFMVTHDARLLPGTRLSGEHFRVGQYVTATGKTVDWGFEGGMHRWGMKGQRMSQNPTKSHRRVGTVGTAGDKMVLPGKKMPGHMGYEWRRHVGVEIMRINVTDQVIYVKSQALPGETNQVLLLTDAWNEGKRIQNPPFPTFVASSPIGVALPDGEPIEYYNEKLFNFDSPSIEFATGGDDAYQLALRRAAVKKQAKAKRK